MNPLSPFRSGCGSNSMTTYSQSFFNIAESDKIDPLAMAKCNAGTCHTQFQRPMMDHVPHNRNWPGKENEILAIFTNLEILGALFLSNRALFQLLLSVHFPGFFSLFRQTNKQANWLGNFSKESSRENGTDLYRAGPAGKEIR